MAINVSDSVRSDLGAIQISPDVIATIAGLATIETEGVAGMSGGIAGGIAELLGRKQLTKGVRVEILNERATIDVSVIVHYGVRIPDVSFAIQSRIQNALQEMTGLAVEEVNVHVLDVLFRQVDSREEDLQLQHSARVR
jgi:uncharacterized alkaline shock family protein YloU